MAAVTAILAVIAVGVIIYAVGVERTSAAATTAASGTKRVATSSYTAGAAGLGIGMQLGYELMMAIAQEPFALTTVIAGVTGALGIEGMLGGVSGLQYLLIGIAAFALTYAVAGRGE